MQAVPNTLKITNCKTQLQITQIINLVQLTKFSLWLKGTHELSTKIITFKVKRMEGNKAKEKLHTWNFPAKIAWHSRESRYSLYTSLCSSVKRQNSTCTYTELQNCLIHTQWQTPAKANGYTTAQRPWNNWQKYFPVKHLSSNRTSPLTKCATIVTSTSTQSRNHTTGGRQCVLSRSPKLINDLSRFVFAGCVTPCTTYDPKPGTTPASNTPTCSLCWPRHTAQTCDTETETDPLPVSISAHSHWPVTWHTTGDWN